ncbi:MAG: hypothetical protein AB8E74_05400 [Prochlorococcus sp.]|nr:hypothetical protein [Prochlorococcaceae cyanobacterium Fu_MAG_50]
MPTWSDDVENELSHLIKEWLKQQERTQADLRRSLRATSTRMPALMEELAKEHQKGGISQVAARLCAIEAEWAEEEGDGSSELRAADPFSQLDLLLNEIRHDCSS